MLQYFHACLFSPTKSTLLKAIQNGNLATWPALTHDNVHKYMDETTATALGILPSKIFLPPRHTKILPAPQEDSQPMGPDTQVKQSRLAPSTSKGEQEISTVVQGFYGARPPRVKIRDTGSFQCTASSSIFIFSEIDRSTARVQGCVGTLLLCTVLLYVRTYSPHSLSPISPEQSTLHHNLAHN